MILLDLTIINNLSKSYDNNFSERIGQGLLTWKLNEAEKVLHYFPNHEGLSLLDVGAGIGEQAEYFKSKGLNVTCIDISPIMLEQCLKKGIQSYIMDVHNITFGNEMFDIVWSMNSLLHVPKETLKTALLNIKNILKPDGKFYLGMYGGYDFEGIWDEDTYNPKRFFSFYTDLELKKILNQYFEIVSFNVVSLNNPLLHYQSIILKK